MSNHSRKRPAGRDPVVTAARITAAAGLAAAIVTATAPAMTALVTPAPPSAAPACPATRP